MTEADFDNWMNRIDRLILKAVGVSVHDLADAPFRDWFESEVTPLEAATMMLEESW